MPYRRLQIDNLKCKLLKHLITDGGEFIPKGSIVKLHSWSEKQRNMINVWVTYHMVDKQLGNDLRCDPLPSIRNGIMIEVDPKDLEYHAGYTDNQYD